MRNPVKMALILALACVAVFAFLAVTARQDSMIRPAYAQEQVVAREAMMDGKAVGEVAAYDEVLFRIRTSAGGKSPVQRAETVAERLNKLLNAGPLTSDSITTGRVNGQDVVLAGGEIIVTADEAHAKANQTTTMQLASLWATRIENVLVRTPEASVPIVEKVVPIISVGSGARIGGALVTGPSDKVALVKAVAQLEGDFQRAVRVRVMIPVSTENVMRSIERVPQTSVEGIIDVKVDISL